MKYPELPEEIKIIGPEPLRPLSGFMPPRIPQEIRFVPEFESGSLDTESEKTLQTQSFTVSAESNRMGYRLRGVPLKRSIVSEMISSAVCRGTIQLLPDGQLVILMADAQTTGGYPRLGYVSAVDLCGLSRLGPGDTFSFRAVTEREAVQSLLRQEEYFKTSENIPAGF